MALTRGNEIFLIKETTTIDFLFVFQTNFLTDFNSESSIERGDNLKAKKKMRITAERKSIKTSKCHTTLFHQFVSLTFVNIAKRRCMNDCKVYQH